MKQDQQNSLEASNPKGRQRLPFREETIPCQQQGYFNCKECEIFAEDAAKQ